MNKTVIFENNNGRTYNVLAVLEFNEQDKKEYADSWQETRAMLLQDTGNGEYVVGQYVGQGSWAFGSYFDELSDATEKFNEVVTRYSRV